MSYIWNILICAPVSRLWVSIRTQKENSREHLPTNDETLTFLNYFHG
jgi:hypothetical protein